MRRKHRSPISEIFDLFIYYKIFETIISIIILIITYHYFPTPFHFFYNIIQQNIK
jgi:hypothetical protein